MHQFLLLLSEEPQMVLAVVVGLLGLMFLTESASRRSVAARWLAGTALYFGIGHSTLLIATLFTPIDADTRAALQTLIGAPAAAGAVAGVVAIYRPGKWPLAVFWLYLIAAPCAALGLQWWWGFNAYYGTVINAIGLGTLAVWTHAVAPTVAQTGHDRSTSLVLALATFPALVVAGLLSGLDLAEIRRLVTVPVGIIFVVLMTQILQMDARLVAAELREKDAAQAALKELNNTLELQVERRTEQLTQINRGLQSFAGMVSHDLSAPVRNISGLSRMALQDHREGRHDALESMLELIGQESLRANAMVHDLLTLAKTDGHKPALTPVAMGPLVDECIRSLALQYPDAGRVIEVDALPTLQADPGLMRHVITNLLSNALKFGGDQADLRIRMSVDDCLNHWRFVIRDNGPGFDPGRAAELFKPFVRLHADDVAGTGLGLTVVQRAVELHGGEVGATATQPGGATFWWTIPKA